MSTMNSPMNSEDKIEDDYMKNERLATELVDDDHEQMVI